jgi:hypothetical protein
MGKSLAELFVMAVFRETAGHQDCNGLDCFSPGGGSDVRGNSIASPVKDSSSLSKRDQLLIEKDIQESGSNGASS